MSRLTPCPGVPWDVRPQHLIQPCRTCMRPHDPDAAIKAPAYHDGERWHCPERIAADFTIVPEAER